MFLKAIREISKPHWFEIILLLKKSVGMSVAEVAKELGMSYMGVKQHLVALEKKGYLDTWRRPKAVGRPEKTYRLTEKANDFFPEITPDLTLEILDSIKSINGESAVEKLLFSYFQKRGQSYIDRLKRDKVSERASDLARLRSNEGRMTKRPVEWGDDRKIRIYEFHDPLRTIAKSYPAVHRMEEQMIERVMGAPVERVEEAASGLSKITFCITPPRDFSGI